MLPLVGEGQLAVLGALSFALLVGAAVRQSTTVLLSSLIAVLLYPSPTSVIFASVLVLVFSPVSKLIGRLL